MPSRWKQVVRLRFKGDRFRDHALDLGALSELQQFQKMVAETAKALWRAGHPDRERLPPHFDERTRLCLRAIEDGSATTPLEVYIGEKDQAELWDEEPPEVPEAISLAYEVFQSLETDKPLPDRFPRGLIAEYRKWGETLTDDEVIEFVPPQRPPTPVTSKHSRRLAHLDETPHESYVEISGEVLEADVRQKRFELWIDEKTRVPIDFSDKQEAEVTTALKEHKTLRMLVKGSADVSAQGKVLKIKRIEELEVHPVGEIAFDQTAKPIGEILEELAREIPQAEWSKLPTDLTDNLDHYIYGTPKR